MGSLPIRFISSCVLSLLLLFPAVCLSYETYIHSRAAFYGTSDGYGTPSGACGYGEFGRTVNDGVVAAVSKLYRNGAGCGACYQVRCTIPELCNEGGVKLMVTDRGYGDNTDFILSTRGFDKLARPDMSSKLRAYGVVDIEYKRISCEYPGYNLMFKVIEQSRFPDYLALTFIYKAGQSDITAVELSQEGGQQWWALRNAYGAVWDLPNPPKGPFTLRFQVSGKGGTYWMQANNAIPKYWKAGYAYDSQIQLPY